MLCYNNNDNDNDNTHYVDGLLNISIFIKVYEGVLFLVPQYQHYDSCTKTKASHSALHSRYVP